MKRPLRPSPALTFLVPFAYGIYLGHPTFGLYLYENILIHLSFIFLFFFFSLGLLRIEKNKKYLQHHQIVPAIKLYVVLISCFGILTWAGYFHYSFYCKKFQKLQNPLLKLTHKRQEALLVGEIASVPVPKKSGWIQVELFITHALIGDNAHKIGGKLLGHFKETDWREFIPGRAIAFRARLYEIRNFCTKGTFDFSNYWALRKIKIKALCQGPFKMTFLEHGRNLDPFTKFFISIERIRFRLACLILDTLGSEKGSIAIGLCLGNRGFMPWELRKRFSVAGLSHLFAISGLHVLMAGLVGYVICLFLCKRSNMLLKFSSAKNFAFIGSVILSTGYCLISGMNPPVIRALIMAYCILACLFSQRITSSENYLAIAAWIILLLDPRHLFHISFQLSFYIVFFLIHLSPLMKEVVKRLVKRSYLFEFVFFNLLIFFIALPLVAFYFHRFNPFSPFLNILAICVVEFFILPLLLFWVFFAISGLVFKLPLILSGFGIDLIQRLIYSWPVTFYIDKFINPPTLFELIAIIAVMLIIPHLNRKGLIYLTILIVLASGTSIVINGVQAEKSELGLYVLDVGQGLSQIILFPNGQVAVADAGPGKFTGFNAGEAIIGPFLRKIGVREIAFLSISHGERDHIGGAFSLLSQFRIKEIWLPSCIDRSKKEVCKLLKLAREKAIKLKFINGKGKEIKIGQVIVSPFCLCQKSLNTNNKSLVLDLNFKGRKILLSGDIERAAEKILVEKGWIKDKHLVIVVPHHGSITSSSQLFLDKIKPKIAICSCGFQNLMRLPRKEIVKRYQNIGARFLNTATEGSTFVKILDDGKVKISTFYDSNGFKNF